MTLQEKRTMTDEEVKEHWKKMDELREEMWPVQLWRYENVGAFIDGELVCLDCLTKEELGKAQEAENTSCRDLYVDSCELDQGPTACERCGKQLISNEKRKEIAENEKKEMEVHRKTKQRLGL